MLEFIVCFYILGGPSFTRIWGLEKTGSHKIRVSSNYTSNMLKREFPHFRNLFKTTENLEPELILPIISLF